MLKKIGMLMKQPQEDFDKYLIPTCIDELTSPVIHHLLNYPPVQEYIFGGKGVGFQGDGTAQFISKNEEYQEKIIEIINCDFLQMKCVKMTTYAKQ